MEFTERDLTYIRANYVPLEQICFDHVRAQIDRGLLPRPSYVLDDGTDMVPVDYFRLLDEAGAPAALGAEFERRHAAACREQCADPAQLKDDWGGYMSGMYGVCLRDVTPETIVRKGALVDSLTQLLAEPRWDDAKWRELVRTQVDELDELEREFAPDYDRQPERFGRPPSRDVLIEANRERFPELFS